MNSLNKSILSFMKMDCITAFGAEKGMKIYTDTSVMLTELLKNPASDLETGFDLHFSPVACLLYWQGFVTWLHFRPMNRSSNCKFE